MRSLPLAVLILGGIITIGAAIGGTIAVAAAVIIASAFGAIAWWGGPWIVARRIGARPFAGSEPPALARALATVQAEGGDFTVLRAESLAPNAVALDDGRIVLSDGLLQALNEGELAAVLRHLRARPAVRGDTAAAPLLLPVVLVTAPLKSLLFAVLPPSRARIDRLREGGEHR